MDAVDVDRPTVVSDHADDEVDSDAVEAGPEQSAAAERPAVPAPRKPSEQRAVPVQEPPEQLAAPAPREAPEQPAPVDGGSTEADGGSTEVDDGLTERERQVLAFERRWWRHAGAKEQAIRDLFDVSSTRYYQMLNGLLDNPAALAHDPVLVKRLRRLRATRTRARTGGRLR
jgi:hypothetical protein